MKKSQILTPWVYRRWRFEFPAELYPAVIERLRGLPPRAEELAASLDAGLAARAPEGGWSVQRHLGHLADLEDLFMARLDAYERGDAALPAADMANARTVQGDHDQRALADVLRDVRSKRIRTVARLESIRATSLPAPPGTSASACRSAWWTRACSSPITTIITWPWRR